MFIIMLRYIKPIEVVDQYIVPHRAYLDQGYQKGHLIASGPKNPRDGGIILSKLTTREAVIEFMQNDPFIIQGIAEYELIEFHPVKYHPDFANFIN